MILEFPGTGYGSAGNPTARRVELFADWIEASVLAGSECVSKPNLVEGLQGSGRVRNSSDAWDLVNETFVSCRRRQKILGSKYPFSVAGDHVDISGHDALAYRFCLLASLPEQFTTLRTSYPSAFRDLFEHLVAEAVRCILPNWNVYETGWSTIAAAGRGQIVAKIADWSMGKVIEQAIFENANDGQVDLAAVRHFSDGRSAVPAFLGQCATGVTDWKTKIPTPNLDRWHNAVQFSAKPNKLFAVPFALDQASFREAASGCRGLVLDRTRICEAAQTLPTDLAIAMQDWIKQATEMVEKAA